MPSRGVIDLSMPLDERTPSLRIAGGDGAPARAVAIEGLG